MSLLDEIDFVVEPFEGVVYRMHNPEWAFAPLSGEGARLFGGRFNIEGESALYTAMDHKTAFIEASDCAATPGLVSPMLLVSYKVKINKALNLVHYKELFDVPWELLGDRYIAGKGDIPITWELYLKARQLSVEALLVPSYANEGGVNMVFIEWSNTSIQIHDPEHRLKSVYGDKLELI